MNYKKRFLELLNGIDFIEFKEFEASMTEEQQKYNSLVNDLKNLLLLRDFLGVKK